LHVLFSQISVMQYISNYSRFYGLCMSAPFDSLHLSYGILIRKQTQNRCECFPRLE